MAVTTFYSKRFVLVVFAILVVAALFFLPSKVSAQVQETPFSGNNISSYQCFNPVSNEPEEPSGEREYGDEGYFLCNCYDAAGEKPLAPLSNGNCPSRDGNFGCTDVNGDGIAALGEPGCPAIRAVLVPPTLQQVEIWFVRIVYIIWALIATFSVFYLVVLGYQYMITRGDVTKITEIRQKIIYYIIGTVLIFLAVPILTTVFRLLSINNDVDCYNVNLDEIGFQFFFPTLCTGRDITYYCNNLDQYQDGLICNEKPGELVTCQSRGVSTDAAFQCTSDQVWIRVL